MVTQAANTTALLAAGEIKENSSDGRQTTFKDGGVTSEQVVQLWVYLVDIFDTSKAELVAAGDATPSDASVMAQIEVNLRPIYGAVDNYMWLVK